MKRTARTTTTGTQDALWQKLDSGPLTVETVGLVKRYRRKNALTGLDLSVPDGSVYLLAGPNGAGKTTTLKILMDLVRADEGSVRVFDRPVPGDGADLRAEIGYVPENHDASVRWLSVARLLAHHGIYYPDWDDGYAGRLVESLDIPLEARVYSSSEMGAFVGATNSRIH
jgi:ABC-2 type transport system ATP-binding protein